MHTALFLSPHLDDVAFSCAGTLVRLLQAGWRVTLATIFTATVPDAHGFALQRQIEQGCGEGTDYMALRRTEDAAFARAVNLRDLQHWDFAEAPYRGYHNKAELFAGIKSGDEIWRPISDRLCETIQGLKPDAVFAPQGLSNHVDHLQTILALKATDNLHKKTRWYREAAYVIRHPDALPSSLLPPHLEPDCISLKEMDLERKIIGCCAYASQLNCHFGGSNDVALKLRAFHRREAQSLEATRMERYAECFLIPKDLPPLF